MKIHPIIYETTRGLHNLDDKLSIATLCLFCYKSDRKVFSELLYGNDYENLVDFLNDKYKDYDVNFNIRLEINEIRLALQKTVEKIREKEDKDGYLKALFSGDDFALAIYTIVNVGFSNVKIKKITNEVNEQLKLMF